MSTYIHLIWRSWSCRWCSWGWRQWWGSRGDWPRCWPPPLPSLQTDPDCPPGSSAPSPPRPTPAPSWTSSCRRPSSWCRRSCLVWCIWGEGWLGRAVGPVSCPGQMFSPRKCLAITGLSGGRRGSPRGEGRSADIWRKVVVNNQWLHLIHYTRITNHLLTSTLTCLSQYPGYRDMRPPLLWPENHKFTILPSLWSGQRIWIISNKWLDVKCKNGPLRPAW